MSKKQVDYLLKGLKIVTIGCWVMAAKFYSEARYYQGRIDANSETNERLQKIVNDFDEKYGIDREEA